MLSFGFYTYSQFAEFSLFVYFCKSPTQDKKLSVYIIL